jgi:hypothetical protein
MINYGQVIAQPQSRIIPLPNIIQRAIMSSRRITHINYRPFCH